MKGYTVEHRHCINLLTKPVPLLRLSADFRWQVRKGRLSLRHPKSTCLITHDKDTQLSTGCNSANASSFRKVTENHSRTSFPELYNRVEAMFGETWNRAETWHANPPSGYSTQARSRGKVSGADDEKYSVRLHCAVTEEKRHERTFH